MTFNDDDFKRLKECSPNLQGGDIYIQLPTQIYGLGEFRKFNLTVLLARLEAAEDSLKSHTFGGRCPCNDCDIWRKVAGK